MHRQLMSGKDDAQLMLREIRLALSQNQFSNLEEIQSVSNNEVQRFLSESFQLVQEDERQKNDPHLIHSKVSEASILLSEESSMIKNYVKSKIQSQCFGVKQHSKQQKKLVFDKKRELQKKRLAEKIEEGKRINNMIEQIRKLNQGASKITTPLYKMEGILYQEGQNIDNYVKEQYKVKSSNNRVKEKEKLQFDNFGQKIQAKNRKRKDTEENVGQLQIQIHGVEEDSEIYAQNRSKMLQDRIQSALKKNKNFLQVFAGFLNKQLEKNKVVSVVIPEDDSLKNIKKVKKRFRFDNQFEQKFPQEPNIGPSVGKLCQVFQFKSFVQQKEVKYEQKIQKNEIKKVISKRNGQTNKYHMKSCILDGNKFYYSDEQGENLKMSEMKFIQLSLNPLEFVNLTKEQGGVFQKKETQIQAVILRGSNRTFTFQLNFAQGVPLTQELNKIYLRNFHRINCLVGVRHNKDMGRFIQQEYPTLNLSQNYIKFEEDYPKSIAKQRSNFIKMLSKLFPSRKSTHILNFKKCGLSFNDLNLIIKQCENNFTQIDYLDFSETKLDSRTFKNIINLVKKCPSPKTATLILNNCGIDDNVIESNISDLSNLCSKIGQLSLSKNQITAQSIKQLKNIFSSKVCEIKILTLNGNPIKDFSEFASLVKSSNKIQKIFANECNLTINNQKVVEDLLVSTKQQQELKIIELKRNTCTGPISWFEQISPYLQISIDLAVKSSSRTIESKYLRVLSSVN